MDRQVIITGEQARFIASCIEIGYEGAEDSQNNIDAAVALEQLLIHWSSEPSIQIAASSHEDESETPAEHIVAIVDEELKDETVEWGTRDYH